MASPTDDVGARVKAARAFARKEPDELARLIREAGFRFSRSTLDRVEAGKRHLDVREAQAIADTCSVPLNFLVRGVWTPDVLDRVDELDRRVAALEEGRKTLTREQSDFILDELLGDGAKEARGSSRGRDPDHRKEGGPSAA